MADLTDQEIGTLVESAARIASALERIASALEVHEP